MLKRDFHAKFALAVLLLSACDGAHEREASDPSRPVPSPSHEIRPARPDGFEQINYRGRLMTAARYGDQLVIDGDIVVGPADLAIGSRSSHQDKGVHASGTVGPTTIFQWPNGIVPYTFDASVSPFSTGGAPSQQALLQQAMQAWAQTTPGLSFVPLATQANYITFRVLFGMDVCGRSHAGHQGAGQQFIDLDPNCLGYGSYHELGHALGLFHEQTRNDVTANVTINWRNIQGCPSAATVKGQCGNAACSGNPLDCGCTADQIATSTCDYSWNFGTEIGAADILGYDFDSIMHYGPTAFGKCRNATGGLVLCSTGGTPQTTMVPPAGVTIGQRDHLSAGDRSAMQAMYPKLTLTPLVFARTGAQQACRLIGREADVGTYFALNGLSSTPGSATIETAPLAPGDLSVTCSARSLFWKKGYRYPNSTITTSPTELNANPVVVENYVISGNVRVLDPGLIAVMFSS